MNKIEKLNNKGWEKKLNEEWNENSQKRNILVLAADYLCLRELDFIHDFAYSKAKELKLDQNAQKMYATDKVSIKKDYIDLSDFNHCQQSKENILNKPDDYFLYADINSHKPWFFLANNDFWSEILTNPKSTGILFINLSYIQKRDFQSLLIDSYVSIFKHHRLPNDKELSKNLMIIAFSDIKIEKDPDSTCIDLEKEKDFLSLFNIAHYEIDRLEWIERRKGILNKNIYDFLKQDPKQNLELDPPTDDSLIGPSLHAIERFNTLLCEYESNPEKYNNSTILDLASSSCGRDWANRFVKWFVKFYFNSGRKYT